MTILGKNRLVKVIFTNVLKVSDGCENSFGRYIMIAQCMRNVFALLYIFKFLWKKGISEKIKAHLPPATPSITTIVQPHLINFIQKSC